MANTNLKFPFGAAEALAPDYAASVALQVDDNVKTHVVIDDVNGNLELAVTANSGMEAGAMLFILLTDISATADTLTLSGDASGTLADLGANATDLIQLEFIGGKFQVVSQQAQ